MTIIRSITKSLIILTALGGIAEAETASCPPGMPHAVSLSPDSTEILAEFIPPACFQAVDANSNYPPGIEEIPVAGDFYSVNLEFLGSLRFDIIAAGNSFNGVFLEKLKKSYPDILIMKLESAKNVPESIREAGKRIGMAEEAGRKAEKLEKILRDTENRFRDSPRVRVLPVIWQKPLIGAAPGTYIDELIRICGGENILPRSPVKYPEVSAEALLSGKADIIINFTGGSMSEGASGSGAAEPLPLPNGLNIREYRFSNQDLVMRSTPRSLTQGLPEICGIIESARAFPAQPAANTISPR
ncbi:helical backbone metal receptor [Succinimonas sp.]|uniref:helical backbone metal receptor n=1 Tax=Succinimonas sp. TaxID=1936151 RepID=UPI0038696561